MSESLEYFFETKNFYPYDKLLSRLTKDTTVHSELEQIMPAFLLIEKKQKKGGEVEIRGMSGVFEAIEGIGRLVSQLAVNAAFFDPKAPRLKPFELNEISFKVVLPQPFESVDERDIQNRLEDNMTLGVMLRSRGRFAYALPHTRTQYDTTASLIRVLKLQLGVSKKMVAPIEYSCFSIDTLVAPTTAEIDGKGK